MFCFVCVCVCLCFSFFWFVVVSGFVLLCGCFWFVVLSGLWLLLGSCCFVAVFGLWLFLFFFCLFGDPQPDLGPVESAFSPGQPQRTHGVAAINRLNFKGVSPMYFFLFVLSLCLHVFVRFSCVLVLPGALSVTERPSSLSPPLASSGSPYGVHVSAPTPSVCQPLWRLCVVVAAVVAFRFRRRRCSCFPHMLFLVSCCFIVDF